MHIQSPRPRANRPRSFFQAVEKAKGFFDSLKRRTSPVRRLSLSINPLYGVRGSFTQGELEGAKPASNQIKCRAKPCLARRAWSEATIFVPQGGTKITTLFQAVERAKGFFDSLKRRTSPVRRLMARIPPCGETSVCQPISAASALSIWACSASACFFSVIAPTMGSPTMLPFLSTT